MSIQARPLSFADQALPRQKNNTRHEEMFEGTEQTVP